MKVLFLTNQLDVGGIETNLVRLTHALTTRGHRVSAATAGGRLVPALEEAGGEHHRIDTSSAAMLRTARALRSLLAVEDPDVVHVFSASTAMALRLAVLGSRSRPPVVASIMGLKTDPAEPHLKTLLRAYATTLGADRVVLMSPAITKVVRRLPVRSHRTVSMSVVGVETPAPPEDARASVRSELGITPETKLVSTIGRLDPTKSHELFIRAAAQVVDVQGDVVFLVVGGGSLRDELEGLIRRTGHADRIRLLGEREDVTRLLAASDVYVRPGVVEGFIGITVLEAQVLRVPTIAFETEDVKLAIEHGQSGLLVPAYDTASLAATVIDLLRSPARAAELGAAGSAVAMARYGLDAVVERLEWQYTALASRRRSLR